jgi:hypothetical protein
VLTESPAFTRTSLTVPDAGERISFSIFIASKTKSNSPDLTADPGCTETLRILPGMGADTVVAPAGAGVDGAGDGAGAGTTGAGDAG